MKSTIEKLAFLSSSRIQRFIFDNENVAHHKLLLNPPDIIIGWEAEVVDQIICRKKAKDKIPEWYNCPGIIYPSPLAVEQASSSKTALYKSEQIEGDHLVDLTGGMGIDCIFLSQNFKQSTYVETDSWLCAVFKNNIVILGLNIQIINSTAQEFINQLDEKVIFYIDPARRDPDNNKIFQFEDCSPDLTELLPQLIEKSLSILIKASPMIDVQKGMSQLGSVMKIFILSINNDCKEVCFYLIPNHINETMIHCMNIHGSTSDEFTFNFNYEKALKIEFSEPKNYLYIPNSSILKSGAFKSITMEYSIKKISASTHLYTSIDCLSYFPGRKIKIIDNDVKSKTLNKLIPEKKANIITRNYPLKPEQIKSKYNLKDGGDHYLICFKDKRDKPRILLGKII